LGCAILASATGSFPGPQWLRVEAPPIPSPPLAPATAQSDISHNLVKEELRTCGRNGTGNGGHLEYLWASLSGDSGE